MEEKRKSALETNLLTQGSPNASISCRQEGERDHPYMTRERSREFSKDQRKLSLNISKTSVQPSLPNLEKKHNRERDINDIYTSQCLWMQSETLAPWVVSPPSFEIAPSQSLVDKQTSILKALAQGRDVYFSTPPSLSKKILVLSAVSTSTGLAVIFVPKSVKLYCYKEEFENIDLGVVIGDPETPTEIQRAVDSLHKQLQRFKNGGAVPGAGGEKEIRVLVTTAEGVFSDSKASFALREVLQGYYEQKRIAFVTVHDSQFIASSSSDYRSEYSVISYTKKLLPSIKMLALASLASRQTRNHIIYSLGLQKPLVFEETQPTYDFIKPSTHLQVACVHQGVYDFTNENNGYLNLKLLDIVCGELTKYTSASRLVYCEHPHSCDYLASMLELSLHEKIFKYTSSQVPQDRYFNYQSWMKSPNGVMVAESNIFTSGVHKPDLGIVIHLGFSKSLGRYYEEMMRGRETGPRLSLLIYHPADIMVHLEPSAENCKQDRDLLLKERREMMFMQRFCEDTFECRRSILCKYFGLDYSNIKENCGGLCDNCVLRMKNSTRSLSHGIGYISLLTLFLKKVNLYINNSNTDLKGMPLCTLASLLKKKANEGGDAVVETHEPTPVEDIPKLSSGQRVRRFFRDIQGMLSSVSPTDADAFVLSLFLNSYLQYSTPAASKMVDLPAESVQSEKSNPLLNSPPSPNKKLSFQYVHVEVDLKKCEHTLQAIMGEGRKSGNGTLSYYINSKSKITREGIACPFPSLLSLGHAQSILSSRDQPHKTSAIEEKRSMLEEPQAGSYPIFFSPKNQPLVLNSPGSPLDSLAKQNPPFGLSFAAANAQAFRTPNTLQFRTPARRVSEGFIQVPHLEQRLAAEELRKVFNSGNTADGQLIKNLENSQLKSTLTQNIDRGVTTQSIENADSAPRSPLDFPLPPLVLDPHQGFSPVSSQHKLNLTPNESILPKSSLGKPLTGLDSIRKRREESAKRNAESSPRLSINSNSSIEDRHKLPADFTTEKGRSQFLYEEGKKQFRLLLENSKTISLDPDFVRFVQSLPEQLPLNKESNSMKGL